jgi:hypothetical protein
MVPLNKRSLPECVHEFRPLSSRGFHECPGSCQRAAECQLGGFQLGIVAVNRSGTERRVERRLR